MANYKSGSERYNDRMDKVMADCRRLERERLERGEMPNPSLTSPEDALRYGWVIEGREVRRAPQKMLATLTDLQKKANRAMSAD